jgi:hypothetical protein
VKASRYGLGAAAASILISIQGTGLAVAQVAGPAGDQVASGPSQPDHEDAQSLYNGEDVTRPENRFDTRFQYRSAWQPAARSQQERTLLRVTSKLGLDARWKLGLLAEVPIVAQWRTTFDPRRSSTDYGIGDAAFQAYLAHDIDRHWAVAFGARGEVPSAGEGLGSKKWQIMPGFGLRYSFVELGDDTYFVPVIRYALSVAGDPAARAISEAQISPLLNIGLADGWFLSLFPSFDVRINFGAPVPGQTGRLFLPFDWAIGHEFSNGATMTLEVSVPVIRDYPVYDFKTELRLSARF